MQSRISGRTQVASIVTVFLLTSTILMGTGSFSNNVVAADPELLNLSEKIDDINESLQSYQTILCEFKGEEGDPSIAVNVSEQLVEYPIFFCSVFERSIYNFTQFPELNNIVYDKLNGVFMDLDMMDTDFSELDADADGLYDEESGMIQYVDVNYDKEDYTEETLVELVDELMLDNDYMDMTDAYIESYFEYSMKHETLTDQITDIAVDYQNVLVESFAYLEENETSEIPPETSMFLESLNPNQIEFNQSGPSGIGEGNAFEGGGENRIQQLDSYKLMNHNHFIGNDVQEGYEAYEVAALSEVEQIRMDFLWHRMDIDPTGGARWIWDEQDNDVWDLLDMNQGWIEDEGQRSMITIQTYRPPDYHLDNVEDWWDDYWDEMPVWVQLLKWPWNLGENRAALFASWGDEENLNGGFNAHSPQRFAHELVQELDDGVGAGEYDIRSFCILNEPNTVGRSHFFEDRFRILSIPVDNGWTTRTVTVIVWLWWGSRTITVNVPVRAILLQTWTTVDLCDVLLTEIQDTIDNDCNNLNDVSLVVNLFSTPLGWANPLWSDLAGHPDLDVLGIDFYWDQPHCSVWPGQIEGIEEQAASEGKEWWVVEMPGGLNPIGNRPNVVMVFLYARYFLGNSADVVGFYRIWGIPTTVRDFAGAYNTWYKDDDNDTTPTAAIDLQGWLFWQWISYV